MASPTLVPISEGADRGEAQPRSRIEIVEGPEGAARREFLERRAGDRRSETGAGARTWILACDIDLKGPWAGVNDLFATLVDEIADARPDLIARHAFELVHVLPALRKTLKLPYSSLTDLAPPEEKVRNYAADRAFRLVHGLIDLLDSWKSAASPHVAWCIACDDYDRAGAIGKRFFRDLMRRRGERLNIHLIAAVRPGLGRDATEWFDAGAKAETMSLDLPEEQPALADREVAAQSAAGLEEFVGDDYVSKQVHLADLIRQWSLAERPDKVLRWKWFATVLYLHLGLYEDARYYTEGLLPMAAAHAPDDKQLRLWILMKTLNGYMGAQDGTGGLRFIEEEVLGSLENPDSREHVEMLFLIAMMHARYKKPRDLARGEAYLDEAIAVLDRIGLPEHEYHFEYVFNRNGVAMIRHFAGRLPEAIELCRAGIDRLNSHVDASKHRLHRSVLVYNIAQVYAAMGSFTEALEYYTAVMEMDPDYSEYYNERGNIYLRLGRLEEARADYLQAIRLSPPYFEVYTNLGQCYRRMGAFAEAVECYGRALDLEPAQVLAVTGRAKAHEELGHRDEAIADYSAALAREPAQWEALASRGVLHYEGGELAASLTDFDRAVELAPDRRDLYKNRSIVLGDLGRHQEASRDVRTALRLDSDGEDADWLRSRLTETTMVQ